MREKGFHSEEGATAVMVAGALVFLFGMAALAVDTSGFYQTARVGQTTADLACLAGAAELPDASDAIEMAHAYAVTNWPEMATATLPGSGNPRTVADGNGNSITYEAGYGGDPDVMYVGITDRDPTTFGRVIGSTSVDIAQEAACERELKMGGPGALPMAALPGTFVGNLHDCAAKVTGNCGALDVGSGANDWRDAIANGWDQQLQKHHGDEGSADPDTGNAVIDCPSAGPCSANDTETGNMQGPFEQGTTTRLSVPGAECTEPGPFNCDSISDVFGSSPVQLEDQFSSEPGWWEESLYGPFSAATARSNHYYFSGDIAHCDSPRLGMVPIMWAPDKKNDPLDWDLGGPPGSWPSGKGTMKVIGFYLVYIREPATSADVGSGPYEADIVYMGAGTTCDGEPFSFTQTGIPIPTVKLVEA